MKKFLAISLLALAVGCVPADEKDPKTCDAECQSNNGTNNGGNNGTEVNDPDLKGSFISGHLGNYWDCPDEGYTPDTTQSDAPAGAPADADFAPCAAEDESCGGPLNCDGAQLTIRLTNGGQGDAEGLEITKIEIFDQDGLSLAVLPVIAAFDASTNETFDGTLEAGKSIDLRVDFRGPANLYELMPADDSGARSSGESALIEVTVSADNHDDVLIDGGEVFVLPTVVT